MKTISDLNALIPTIVKQISKQNHEIGESYYEPDEDGYGRSDDPSNNYFCYEEDGWLIEISYACCGEWDEDPGDYWTPSSRELISAWGKVTELRAYHYDADLDEDSEFSDDDFEELRKAIDKELNFIA